MKSANRTPSWVVYLIPVSGKPDGMTAVCEQREWAEMEKNRPGVYTLIRGGIESEGEAERLARGTSGDRPERQAKFKTITGAADGRTPG
jgi:hypothetical protein